MITYRWAMAQIGRPRWTHSHRCGNQHLGTMSIHANDPQTRRLAWASWHEKQYKHFRCQIELELLDFLIFDVGILKASLDWGVKNSHGHTASWLLCASLFWQASEERLNTSTDSARQSYLFSAIFAAIFTRKVSDFARKMSVALSTAL